MKRRVGKVLLFLLLGAVINIAVAWGIAFERVGGGVSHGMTEFDPARELQDPESRFAGAGVSVQRTRGCTRVWVNFSSCCEGAWDLVPDVDAEVPAWADAYFGEESLTELRRSPVSRMAQCSGWPSDAMSGSFIFNYSLTTGRLTIDRTEYGITLPPKQDTGPWKYEYRILPLRPIWPGFAINTAFYAAILWLLFTLPGVPFALRRRRRIRRGLCPACAYDLRGRGNDSKTCPECGKAVKQQ